MYQMTMLFSSYIFSYNINRIWKIFGNWIIKTFILDRAYCTEHSVWSLEYIRLLSLVTTVMWTLQKRCSGRKRLLNMFIADTTRTMMAIFILWLQIFSLSPILMMSLFSSFSFYLNYKELCMCYMLLLIPLHLDSILAVIQ